MIFQNLIDFLLENACVNIRYLVYRDILKTPLREQIMLEMQEEIIEQKNVQKILAYQHEDGWLGEELHGGYGVDSLMNRLLNCGVETSDVHIQKAITALTTPEIAKNHKWWMAGGDALDADGRGGNKAITAVIMAIAHTDETLSPLSEEIDLSLKHFIISLSYKSVEDFIIRGKSKIYYKPSTMFPDENHICILKDTKSWKNEQNLKTVSSGMEHCYNLMKNFDEYITFKKPKEFGGSFIGPFNFNWQALNKIELPELQAMINSKNRYMFGFWLRTLSHVPKWGIQSTQPYELLADLVLKNNLFNMLNDKTLDGFRRLWGIESSWKNETNIKCDLIYTIMKVCYPVVSSL